MFEPFLASANRPRRYSTIASAPRLTLALTQSASAL
jgi:hypothetical protein